MVQELPLGLFYDESPHFLYLMQRVVHPVRLIRALTAPGSRGVKTPAPLDAYFASESARYPMTFALQFRESC